MQSDEGFQMNVQNPKLHWCGDKGEWIENCDDLCKMQFLKENFKY